MQLPLPACGDIAAREFIFPIVRYKPTAAQCLELGVPPGAAPPTAFVAEADCEGLLGFAKNKGAGTLSAPELISQSHSELCRLLSSAAKEAMQRSRFGQYNGACHACGMGCCAMCPPGPATAP